MSKLPGNVKKHKEAAELATRTLDQDLVEKKALAHVAPYSDKLFHQASVEWLVATDQVNDWFDLIFLLFLSLTVCTLFCSQYKLFNTPNFKK